MIKRLLSFLCIAPTKGVDFLLIFLAWHGTATAPTGGGYAAALSGGGNGVSTPKKRKRFSIHIYCLFCLCATQQLSTGNTIRRIDEKTNKTKPSCKDKTDAKDSTPTRMPNTIYSDL